MVGMSENKEFALLLGKAFLHEIEVSHKEAAVAFGRAFLLALGMKGPEQTRDRLSAIGKPCGEHFVFAED